VIIYRRKGLAFGELVYEPVPTRVPKVDILRITAPSELPDVTPPARRSNTLVIDLRQEEQALFADMDKNTRYEIKRARREALEYQLVSDCTEDAISRFCDYYDRFAAHKKLRPIFRERLHKLASGEMLILTSALSGDGETLVWHAYMRCTDRVLLLYSASFFRQMEVSTDRRLVGRANRYTHWEDILAFRQMGLGIYDMGGIDVAGRSPETSNIAVFKRGFGGTVTSVFSYTLPRSPVGHVACRVAGALGREI